MLPVRERCGLRWINAAFASFENPFGGESSIYGPEGNNRMMLAQVVQPSLGAGRLPRSSVTKRWTDAPCRTSLLWVTVNDNRPPWKLRAALERAAAEQLGRMLFEFGRLELAVGLLHVWVDRGQRMESRTRRFEEVGFGAKLDALEADVDRVLPKDSAQHCTYTAWLARAHELRTMRNRLAHGRWGIDAATSQVVNVSGLPTSPNQHAARFTIEELEAVVSALHELVADLDAIRTRWPL